jgi:hypothetical protein
VFLDLTAFGPLFLCAPGLVTGLDVCNGRILISERRNLGFGTLLFRTSEEELILKFATAILLLLSSPAFAQTGSVDCPPIGQTAKGELVYGLDCKSLKPENRAEVAQPDMPPTNLKDTVIPKSGKVQTPETTLTTGVNK